MATNACEDTLRRDARRAVPAPSSAPAGPRPSIVTMPWVQPYPDSLRARLAADQPGPEAVAVSRETISLAFLRRLPAHRRHLDQHRHAVRVAGLKHRPDGTVRVIPIPPILACMLGQYLHAFGTAPEGGCSAAPAAACSASRSTAAPGTPPARPRSARTWPPPQLVDDGRPGPFAGTGAIADHRGEPGGSRNEQRIVPAEAG
jgi:hypothetical protein